VNIESHDSGYDPDQEMTSEGVSREDRRISTTEYNALVENYNALLALAHEASQVE
jgi:hypothetical protein